MSSKHHIEQEIKLTAPDQATLDRLIDSSLVRQVACHPDNPFEPHRFAATYYDTPDWALRELRWSLRTRYEGDRHLCTLKRNSKIRDGYSTCEEIEQTTPSGFKNIASIPAGKIAEALRAIFPASMPLLPRVKVTMQRRKRELQLGDTRLELVTDSGAISANGKHLELFEVELELLQGDMHNRFVRSFTIQLAEDFSLRPSLISKHQIGLSCYQVETL